MRPVDRNGRGGSAQRDPPRRHTDGDGTISLQEFQATHERIFRAMDSNKDGKLTPEEMQAFMHGPQ